GDLTTAAQQYDHAIDLAVAGDGPIAQSSACFELIKLNGKLGRSSDSLRARCPATQFASQDEDLLRRCVKLSTSGDLASARSVCGQALADAQNRLGDNVPKVALLHLPLIAVLTLQDDFAAARDEALAAARIFEANHVTDQLADMLQEAGYQTM